MASSTSRSRKPPRTYRTSIKGFFAFISQIHPAEVTPNQVIRYRDHFMKKEKSASTVALRLSVIHSLFEYLRAAGYVEPQPYLGEIRLSASDLKYAFSTHTRPWSHCRVCAFRAASNRSSKGNRKDVRVDRPVQVDEQRL